MSEPWDWSETVARNVTDDTNNNNVLREVATKAMAMPALLGVAAIVYMQMFRQQYNKRNK